MNKILVPTDFSLYAEAALKAAAKLARKTKSEILLLHMMELPSQTNDALKGGSTIPEVMLYMEKLHDLFEKIKAQPYLKGIAVTEIIQFGKVFDGIIASSKKNSIDLIVMGSHGSSGLEEILVGSNTEKIVRHSDIPVLVIKKDTQEFRMDTIVFASDFSNEIKKPFKKVLEFARLFDSTLILVMICTPYSFKPTEIAEKIMNDFVENFELNRCTTSIYNDTDIEKGILNFSNKVNADLVAIGTHSRTALSYFFNGSVSEDLVNHILKPVIAFKIN